MNVQGRRGGRVAGSRRGRGRARSSPSLKRNVPVKHPELLLDEGIGLGRISAPRAPAGSSTSTSSSGPPAAGESARRVYPLSGSVHVGWSPRRARGGARCAPRAAISSDSVSPSAADSRPSSAAVGCASARSTLAIIARETPERSASAAVERPCASRAPWTVWASEVVSSSTMMDRVDYYRDMTVRDATAGDGAACAAIYAPYVTDSVISFELDPPSAAEMASRIAAAHLWLVLEDSGARRGLRLRGAVRRRGRRIAGRVRSASISRAGMSAAAAGARCMTRCCRAWRRTGSGSRWRG